MDGPRGARPVAVSARSGLESTASQRSAVSSGQPSTNDRRPGSNPVSLQFPTPRPRRTLPPPSPPSPRRASALVPSVRGLKIAENQSPRPQDRVYFTFDYFSNVNGALNRAVLCACERHPHLSLHLRIREDLRQRQRLNRRPHAARPSSPADTSASPRQTNRSAARALRLTT